MDIDVSSYANVSIYLATTLALVIGYYSYNHIIQNSHLPPLDESSAQEIAEKLVGGTLHR